MYWEDFLLSRPLRPQELIDWLHDVFDLPESEILVAGASDHAPISDDTAILCEYSSSEGDFPFRVMVFVRRDDLESRDSFSAIVRLCRSLTVSALVSDDTANPYRMVLIEADGNYAAVHLNVDALDQHDSYVVRRTERSLPTERSG